MNGSLPFPFSRNQCMAVALAACVLSGSGTELRASPARLTAQATLSSRWIKPHQSVELLVSVRNAAGRPIVSPAFPPGIKYRLLKPCQLIASPDGGTYVFRYRMISGVDGDFEIPPLRISDGVSTTLTGPLFLKVSNDGKPHPMTARELGMAASIPEPLAAEAVKLLPAPAASPSPSPRGPYKRLGVYGVLSSVLHGFKWFWDYP